MGNDNLSDSAIVEDIRSYIIENFLFGEDSDLRADTSFLDAGIIDSTGILELITHLEETYAIHIEDEEMVPENLDSLERVARFLTAKRGGSRQASV